MPNRRRRHIPPKARHRTSRRGQDYPALVFLVRIVALLVLSPLVLAFDILRRDRLATKTCVMYHMVSLVLVTAVTIGAMAVVMGKGGQVLTALTHYSYARVEVKDMPFAEAINFYATQNDLDPSLVAAVISQESAFEPWAVSPKGARGLMQIMPETWREMNPNSKCSGDHDPPAKDEDCIFDPEANIRTGTAYLRRLIDSYNGQVIPALAAYNAGSGAVSKYIGDNSASGIPPYPETESYVSRVLGFWAALRGEWVEGNLRILRTAESIYKVTLWITAGMWAVLLIWMARKGGGLFGPS